MITFATTSSSARFRSPAISGRHAVLIRESGDLFGQPFDFRHVVSEKHGHRWHLWQYRDDAGWTACSGGQIDKLRAVDSLTRGRRNEHPHATAHMISIVTQRKRSMRFPIVKR